MSSLIHQSAHRAAHHAMELERHGVPPLRGGGTYLGAWCSDWKNSRRKIRLRARREVLKNFSKTKK